MRHENGKRFALRACGKMRVVPVQDRQKAGQEHVGFNRSAHLLSFLGEHDLSGEPVSFSAGHAGAGGMLMRGFLSGPALVFILAGPLLGGCGSARDVLVPT
jgi:hypothetical protein